MPKLEDVVGKTFGNLKVISRAPNKGRHTCYFCQCTCGDIRSYFISNLKRGLTTNCGCIRYKSVSQKLKKTNEVNLENGYLVGTLTNTQHQFYLDPEDWDKLKHLCWIESNYGYALGCLSNGKYILMHRLILDVPAEFVVDHINHNRLDNRKGNLRICSQKNNSRNQQGVKGLYYNKRRNLWQAYITHEGKHIYCGSSKNKKEALKMRIEKEVGLWGDDSQYYHREYYDMKPLGEK